MAITISSSDFDGLWPLTVEEGTLLCDNNAVTFTTKDGKVYGVNGTAKGRGAKPIDPIWAKDPKSPSIRVNISDLINKGLSLCKTDNGATPSTPEQNTATGIGLSFDQVMQQFGDSLTVKKGNPIDGKDNYVSTSPDKYLILQMIGQKENISRVTLTILIPNDVSVVTRNTTTLLQFLRNAIPEWKDSTKWVQTMIDESVKKGRREASVIKGKKRVVMQFVKELATISTTIEESTGKENWYKGGTLHGATGKEWRTATESNRLATAADFVAKANETGDLKFTIQGIDDLKPYATELSTCLTEFLKDTLTDTQQVNKSALMCMITMQWFKSK